MKRWIFFIMKKNYDIFSWVYRMKMIFTKFFPQLVDYYFLALLSSGLILMFGALLEIVHIKKIFLSTIFICSIDFVKIVPMWKLNIYPCNSLKNNNELNLQKFSSLQKYLKKKKFSKGIILFFVYWNNNLFFKFVCVSKNMEFDNSFFTGRITKIWIWKNSLKSWGNLLYMKLVFSARKLFKEEYILYTYIYIIVRLGCFKENAMSKYFLKVAIFLWDMCVRCLWQNVDSTFKLETRNLFTRFSHEIFVSLNLVPNYISKNSEFKKKKLNYTRKILNKRTLCLKINFPMYKFRKWKIKMANKTKMNKKCVWINTH